MMAGQTDCRLGHGADVHSLTPHRVKFPLRAGLDRPVMAELSHFQCQMNSSG